MGFKPVGCPYLKVPRKARQGQLWVYSYELYDVKKVIMQSKQYFKAFEQTVKIEQKRHLATIIELVKNVLIT